MYSPSQPPTDLDRLDAALASRYWKWTFMDPDTCPDSLLYSLIEGLPHIDPSSWPERFDWGGVYLNGKLQTEDCPLKIPCKVEYYEPKLPICDSRSFFPRITIDHVVYQDQDLLIALKPYRLPTMPAKEQRHFSLKNEIEKLTGKTVHIPSRLDMSVFGLVPMSTSARMHRLIQNVFETRAVEKNYVLGTNISPGWRAVTCIGEIGRSQEHPILREVVDSNGQHAQTEFRALENLSNKGSSSSLILAKPITGRTHQIRVHAAFMGVPIIGDNFYGGLPAEKLQLCCYRLRFNHPLRGEMVDFRVPSHMLPEWMAGFSDC